MATKRTEGAATYTDFHADTPESMQNEKRALLAAMAEHGTEGQAELEKARQAGQQARANSIEMAAARGQQIHAPGTLQATLEANYDRQLGGLMDNASAASLGHGREMDRIAAANAAYLDQVSGASALNRDMLAAQMASSTGGGGRGGGGGGGGGGSRSGSTYTAPTGAATDAGWVSATDLASKIMGTGEKASLENMREAADTWLANGLMTQANYDALVPHINNISGGGDEFFFGNLDPNSGPDAAQNAWRRAQIAAQPTRSGPGRTTDRGAQTPQASSTYNFSAPAPAYTPMPTLTIKKPSTTRRGGVQR